MYLHPLRKFKIYNMTEASQISIFKGNEIDYKKKRKKEETTELIHFRCFFVKSLVKLTCSVQKISC